MNKILLSLLLICSSVFADNSPQRIISLAPSVTEILCSLDLQEQIVGTTDFCKDPYRNIDFSAQKLGGMINPNFEKILKVKPDVIFTLKGKSNHTHKLKKYGLTVIELDHSNLDGVFASIKIVGEYCQKEAEATKLFDSLKALLVEPETTSDKTVLITISRLSTQANIRLWVAGNDGFYSKILALCGFKNAHQNKEKFSQMSSEALIQLNPDIIIFLRDKLTDKEKDAETKAWQKFSSIKAIQNNEFHIITGDEILIPGPRFPLVLEKFKKILHKWAK